MRLLTIWLICCITAAAGCGAALEHSSVSRRFSRIFDCPTAQVSGESGGYRAEGCGVVAHFACIDTDSSSEEPIRQAKPGGGRLLGAMLGSMLLDSMEVDTCVLEHSERSTALVSAEPEQANPVYTVHKVATGPVVRTRILFSGGHLAVLGKPARHPEHVLLFVRSQRRLAAAPCVAELFNDGVAVPIEQMERTNDFEARLLLRAESLRHVDRSIRFAGSVCELSFEIVDSGREALGYFEARFSEERARLAARSPAAATSP